MLSTLYRDFKQSSGWSGGAMVLGILPGRRTIWMIVGQGPIALAMIYTEIPSRRTVIPKTSQTKSNNQFDNFSQMLQA